LQVAILSMSWALHVVELHVLWPIIIVHNSPVKFACNTCSWVLHGYPSDDSHGRYCRLLYESYTVGIDILNNQDPNILISKLIGSLR